MSFGKYAGEAGVWGRFLQGRKGLAGTTFPAFPQNIWPDARSEPILKLPIYPACFTPAFPCRHAPPNMPSSAVVKSPRRKPGRGLTPPTSTLAREFLSRSAALEVSTVNKANQLNLPVVVVRLRASSTLPPTAVMAQPQHEVHIADTGDTPGAPGSEQKALHFGAPQDNYIKSLLSRPGDIADLHNT